MPVGPAAAGAAANVVATSCQLGRPESLQADCCRAAAIRLRHDKIVAADAVVARQATQRGTRPQPKRSLVVFALVSAPVSSACHEGDSCSTRPPRVASWRSKGDGGTAGRWWQESEVGTQGGHTFVWHPRFPPQTVKRETQASQR